jgi:hypothetical protein
MINRSSVDLPALQAGGEETGSKEVTAAKPHTFIYSLCCNKRVSKETLHQHGMVVVPGLQQNTSAIECFCCRLLDLLGRTQFDLFPSISNHGLVLTQHHGGTITGC